MATKENDCKKLRREFADARERRNEKANDIASNVFYLGGVTLSAVSVWIFILPQTFSILSIFTLAGIVAVSFGISYVIAKAIQYIMIN